MALAIVLIASQGLIAAAPPDVFGGEPVADDEFRLPVDAATAGRVDRAIDKLGSPSFAERQQASAALVAIGAPAFTKLRAAYQAGGDFEVCSRIEAIVETVYLDYHVFSNFGFLGIRRDQHTPGPEDPESNGLIQPGHCGILIELVTPDTGADRAGLRKGDIIVAVDGRPIPGAGARAFDTFSAEIRSRKPGGKLQLTILRDGGALDVEVTLTRPPPDRTDIHKLREEIKSAKDRFPAWWALRFRGSSQPEEGEGSDLRKP